MIEWFLGAGAAGGIWFSYRYAWWRPAVPDCYPRILMYHMISDPVPGSPYNGMRVSPIMFERHLCWLRDSGWSTRTISELENGRAGLPQKTVAITFDDGYADNYCNALPLLEAYDARATLFLVLDRTSAHDWSRNRKPHHTSGELRAEPKLSDRQVGAMLQCGRIELGSHTVTHPNFALLDTDQKRDEVITAKRGLEQRFGVGVTSFAYPFGTFGSEDSNLVAEAGHTSAVTTEPGIDTAVRPNPFRRKRIRISGRENMLAFAMRIRTGRRGWNK